MENDPRFGCGLIQQESKASAGEADARSMVEQHATRGKKGVGKCRSHDDHFGCMVYFCHSKCKWRPTWTLVLSRQIHRPKRPQDNLLLDCGETIPHCLQMVAATEA